MERIAKYTLNIFLAMVSLPAFSQEVEMADTMRSDGKIYVVVAIILIVLTGLITYLFLLDRKVGKLEEKLNKLK
jgi:K+-transporting ATPase A subunit